jgi:hypothetical protein
MCPANGELEAGNPESPVDFLCQVAHLRVYASGESVPEHGDCPSCQGGVFHSTLMASAHRIANKSIDVGRWVPSAGAATFFPIFQETSSTNSCSSCPGQQG